MTFSARITVGVLLALCLGAVIVALVRVRHLESALLESKRDAENVRAQLNGSLETAANSETKAEALAIELSTLRDQLDSIQQRLQSNAAASRVPTNAAMPEIVHSAPTERLVLTTNDVDPGSIRILRGDPANLIVRLIDKSADDLARLHNEVREVVVGRVVASGPPAFALFKHQGTNSAIVLVLPKEQVDAVASALLGKDAQ